MKKIITILLTLILFLTGCQSHSTIQGVEETAQTLETVTQETTTFNPEIYDENETWAENDERLSYYLPDEYFYDTNGELDFYETLGSKMHIFEKNNNHFTYTNVVSNRMPEPQYHSGGRRNCPDTGSRNTGNYN
ncbi:unknown [Roseburia sp. CAG:303]|nr:unknown [Roseburia sp. CAG:303]